MTWPCAWFQVSLWIVYIYVCACRQEEHDGMCDKKHFDTVVQMANTGSCDFRLASRRHCHVMLGPSSLTDRQPLRRAEKDPADLGGSTSHEPWEQICLPQFPMEPASVGSHSNPFPLLNWYNYQLITYTIFTDTFPRKRMLNIHLLNTRQNLPGQTFFLYSLFLMLKIL